MGKLVDDMIGSRRASRASEMAARLKGEGVPLPLGAEIVPLAEVAALHQGVSHRSLVALPAGDAWMTVLAREIAGDFWRCLKVNFSL